MKKNIIKKTLLIIPLIFSLVGCKKDPTNNVSSDLVDNSILEEPATVTFTRLLDNRETHRVFANVLEKRKDVSKIEQKQVIEENHDIVKIVEVFEQKSKIYQDNCYETTYKLTDILESDNPLVARTDVLMGFETGVFQNNNFYYIGWQEYENEKDYDFNYQENYQTDLAPIVEDSLAFYHLVGEPIFEDEEGNYHIISEKGHFEVEQAGGCFNHLSMNSYTRVIINKDFEIMKFHVTVSVYTGRFYDSSPKPKEEMVKTGQALFGSRVSYEPKEAMRNIDEIIAALPSSIILKSITLQRSKYATETDESGNIRVRIDQFLGNDTSFYLEFKSDKDGNCYTNFYNNEIVLEANVAVKFSLYFGAFNFAEIIVNFDDIAVDLSTGLDESLSEVIKFVQEGDFYFLVYVPKDEDAPISIKIALSADLRIDVIEDELGNPNGEVSASNVHIRENKYGF